ncbi:hypothetical protein CYLTODRAFT_491506 [Cylindrobasidium torrendii FP15055 ss-10]|uniref:Uncharacterized protein n=1 Tax=Cylindrobasidium torrendii FP15055 ss-10 TaxID=1314674 RepID=A0A0D7B7C4_9AGAR|nr:hypothetical protein CYLTODRAFT_491506 [Cylindrobasidium torrendii FP15055 ss-10]
MRPNTTYNPLVIVSGYEMNGADLEKLLLQFYPNYDFRNRPRALWYAYRRWRNYLRDEEYIHIPEILPRNWPTDDYNGREIPEVTFFFPSRAPVNIIEGEDQLSDPILCTPNEQDESKLQEFAKFIASRGKQLDTTKLRFFFNYLKCCSQRLRPRSSYNLLATVVGYEMNGADMENFMCQFYPDHNFWNNPHALLSAYRRWRNYLRDEEYVHTPDMLPKDWPTDDYFERTIPEVAVFFPSRAPVAIVDGEDQLFDPVLCTPNEQDERGLQAFANHIDPKRHTNAYLYYGVRESVFPDGLPKDVLE